MYIYIYLRLFFLIIFSKRNYIVLCFYVFVGVFSIIFSHVIFFFLVTADETYLNMALSNDKLLKNAECERELKTLRQSSKQLKLDNEELKRRMGALEKLSEENARLMRVKEESDIIRSRLSAAEDDIVSLLEEKRLLHETISELRNQRLEDSPGGSNRASWSIKR